MKKKIFVNKDSQQGFRSYLKYLLWAAIGLIVLVLFIPLTSRQKSGKEAMKKPASERGVVVREIPRSLQPVAESITKGQGGSGEAPKEADAKPPVIPDGKSPAAVTTPPQQAAIKEKPLDAVPAPQKVENVADGIPKHPITPEPAPAPIVKEIPPAPKAIEPPAKELEVVVPKKPPVAVKPPAPAKPEKPAAADAKKPPTAPAVATPDSRQQASSEKGKMYAVQVATLKDKQSAEELKSALQKKGFNVVMKTANDPKQGQAYTLQLQPVDNMGKASTLMEQIKYVPKVKATIVPVNKD